MNEDDDRTIKVQIAPGKRSRTLTLIYNVPEDKQTSLLQMLKKKMSCGGTFNKEKKCLQLQGDFKDNICEYLSQQFPEHSVVIGAGDLKV